MPSRGIGRTSNRLQTTTMYLQLYCLMLVISGSHGKAHNVALGETTMQLHDLDKLSSNLAVDGNLNQNQPETQCSTTVGSVVNFWSVEFGSHSISRIVIYGPNDSRGHETLSGFNVFVKSKDSIENVYNNTGVAYGSGVFTVLLEGNVISAVNITRPNILTLCEVEVYTVCNEDINAENTYYGEDCQSTCGKCLDGAVCNATGYCPNGCSDGWHSAKCDIRVVLTTAASVPAVSSSSLTGSATTDANITGTSNATTEIPQNAENSAVAGVWRALSWVMVAISSATILLL
ncbi:uncharacterized protein LOC127860700 isoform X2 [Dreissena polymorpha]|uniref:uncharacterized protein LOC127860700 isoform X2 n=1 Tax=Dreissena polymorpha TaxID=45954 RepID=UPI002265531F|nr:uncharacterized protein LOC127860700 isoform X2 [Dreissena polymorpha]